MTVPRSRFMDPNIIHVSNIISYVVKTASSFCCYSNDISHFKMFLINVAKTKQGMVLYVVFMVSNVGIKCSFKICLSCLHLIAVDQ